MDIVWKSLVGGCLAALIAWTSKRGNVLPGVLILFPTFSLIAFWLAGMKGESGAIKETCVATLKTLPAFLAFLGANYFLSDRFDFRVVLALSLGVWFMVAFAMVFGPKYL